MTGTVFVDTNTRPRSKAAREIVVLWVRSIGLN
jgi:hypothetical protein